MRDNANAVAGRASGGLYMSLFGGLWTGFAADTLLGPVGWAAGALGAAVLAGACLLLLRRTRPLMVAPDVAAERAVRRGFRWINLAQWAAIFIVAQVLSRLHLQGWVLPAVMAIIGLHFLPLAYLFQYRAHRWTGLALLAWALAYPWLCGPQAGVPAPQSPFGPLGTGLILWCSVAWVLWRQRGWLARRG